MRNILEYSSFYLPRSLSILFEEWAAFPLRLQPLTLSEIIRRRQTLKSSSEFSPI